MTATAQPKKAWFRINKNVEYSTDYNFFLEHQITIVKSGKVHQFNSRLEAKQFKKIISPYKDGSLTDAETESYLRTIHREILAGEHHTNGKFVD